MTAGNSDALVFFGAKGDLAYKKIFPALQAMVKHGTLNTPGIGVARADWGIDQLREQARKSIEEYGGGVDPTAFDKLMNLLRYVGGDYDDDATFEALRKELGDAKHPTHYLAVPPSIFSTVGQGLGKSGCADGARVVIEKPFGTDLASARAPHATIHSVLEQRPDPFRKAFQLRPWHQPSSPTYLVPVLPWKTCWEEQQDSASGVLRHQVLCAVPQR